MKYLTLICALMLVVACGQKSDAPATTDTPGDTPAKTMKENVPSAKVAMKTVTLDIEGMT